MPSHRVAEVDGSAAAAGRPLRDRALLILWPAFVMAGVLEALVFVVVDPLDSHRLGADLLGWSASAVYSVAFLVFWGVIATAAAVTLLLDTPVPGPNRMPPP